MKYYAVIDTNVLVSAVLKWNSVPGNIIDLTFNDVITPLVNQEILNEYKTVLLCPIFPGPGPTTSCGRRQQRRHVTCEYTILSTMCFIRHDNNVMVWIDRLLVWLIKFLNQGENEARVPMDLLCEKHHRIALA